MPTIINPFDAAGGFSLAEMTESMNIMPNTYGRIGSLGLFNDEGITQTTVIIEMNQGVLNLLPTVPRGAPPTVANRDTRNIRSFVVPHIPHDDVVKPEDLQGQRAFGSPNAPMNLAGLMDKKLARLRLKHEQTREFMRLQSLKGVLRDGAGVTLYNWYTEFGITKKTVDFLLGTGTTNIKAKIAEVKRHIEDNLLGESMTGIRALVSSTFWDKFINHTEVKESFKYFEAQQNPNRDDLRRGFTFHGVTFEEYNATWTLSDGSTTEKAFTNDYGTAFPIGTSETFMNYYAPANLLETVNTTGVPFYARQITRQDGRGIDIMSESNPLPINRRPALSVEIHTSN